MMGKSPLKCGKSESSSGVFPENVISKMVSCFPTLPKSPWRASVGCRYVACILRLFIVATNFLAICPLLPTPEITSLPFSSSYRVIASTAALKPRWAVWSVSYNRVKNDNAVASVPSTWTALDILWAKDGCDSRISGGVIDIKSGTSEISSSHGVAGEGGDGGGTEGGCDEFMR